MRALILLLALGLASACDDVYRRYELSPNFNETIAHAVHSMTVEGLQMFNPRASLENQIPTVTLDLRGPKKVQHFAPHDPLKHNFDTEPMNRIDKILSNIGSHDDGLGPNWSPVERIAHSFHMHDLWHRIHHTYQRMQEHDAEEFQSEELCRCLTDTASNGIEKAVSWVADHYNVGTPITLLNRPIPKLTDANTWQTWKDRLLHYYTPEALRDAAIFMHCSTKQY
eukprot:scpid90528/ scgid6558/ 